MYFEIYKQHSAGVPGLMDETKPTQWRWRLNGDNHETIASGEGYSNYQDCRHAVTLLQNTNKETPVKDI